MGTRLRLTPLVSQQPVVELSQCQRICRLIFGIGHRVLLCQLTQAAHQRSLAQRLLGEAAVQSVVYREGAVGYEDKR